MTLLFLVATSLCAGDVTPIAAIQMSSVKADFPLGPIDLQLTLDGGRFEVSYTKRPGGQNRHKLDWTHTFAGGWYDDLATLLQEHGELSATDNGAALKVVVSYRDGTAFSGWPVAVDRFIHFVTLLDEAAIQSVRGVAPAPIAFASLSPQRSVTGQIEVDLVKRRAIINQGVGKNRLTTPLPYSEYLYLRWLLATLTLKTKSDKPSGTGLYLRPSGKQWYRLGDDAPALAEHLQLIISHRLR